VALHRGDGGGRPDLGEQPDAQPRLDPDRGFDSPSHSDEEGRPSLSVFYRVPWIDRSGDPHAVPALSRTDPQTAIHALHTMATRAMLHPRVPEDISAERRLLLPREQEERAPP
jgi:hypothetical protein